MNTLRSGRGFTALYPGCKELLQGHTLLAAKRLINCEGLDAYLCGISELGKPIDFSFRSSRQDVALSTALRGLLRPVAARGVEMQRPRAKASDITDRGERTAPWIRSWRSQRRYHSHPQLGRPQLPVFSNAETRECA